MRVWSLVTAVTVALVGAVTAGACTTKEPQTVTFFDQTIDPILQTSCVRTNTGVGCHVSDTKGNALGNLDLSSYDGVDRRRDLLLDYGPYQQPSILVKNVPPYQVAVQFWDGTTVDVTTDIKHTGGPILDPTSSGYDTLREWIENGATLVNSGVPPVNYPRTGCNDFIPSVAGFDPTMAPAAMDFQTFQGTVEPLIESSCNAGNCHGTQVNALYFACGGDNQQEVWWNYYAASQYVSATPQQSEIVRRPLATSQGGSYHEGGPIYASVQDPNYQAMLQWATARGAPSSTNLDPAFLFFAERVQPILVKKGCMMAQCHSAGMFHDYRLRGGSAGSFSLNTSMKNYAFSVSQMSFESDDVTASRLVRKNLYRPEVMTGSNGILHRGGPLFEDFGNSLPSGAICDAGSADGGPYNYDTGDLDQIPAFCVIREWHARERAERNPTALSAIVYVSRSIPAGPDRAQDFDVFAGGATLHIAQATQTVGTGAVTVGADNAVDLSGCGLPAGSDIKRPSVSWDGQTIAFAGRSSAGSPLSVYTIKPDGTGCAQQPDIANHAPTANSILEHDFDPVFSPPGPDGTERIVFASTRGNLDSSAFDYSGPTVTPEDPTKPNANLYVLEPDPTTTGKNRVRQLTWQLNMERMPNFMEDGRLIMSIEKREPDFYELALRRQNLDGSDYHPLYSQRPTIGYQQATYPVQLTDKNFATVFSNQGTPHMAGALGVFNRSIGVDFTSTTASDYVVDSSVITPGSSTAVEPAFFLHSVSNVYTDGSYTSPSALPDDQILVSFGSGAPSSFGGDYDVYVMDAVSGNKTQILGNAGTAEVEAVGVYARVPKGIFVPVGDEPNGNTTIHTTETIADVTVLDMTTLASLLFQNTPTGRPVEPDLPSFDVYEDLPPDVTSFPACGGNTFCDSYGMVYVRRRFVGTVPVLGDGSSHFKIPGGLPVVLHLADDKESAQNGTPRWQREEMTFVQGEYAHQSFRGTFFNGLCAFCHGSISGQPVDVGLNPDFLTQASAVDAISTPPVDLTGPPSSRGPVEGPPANP